MPESVDIYEAAEALLAARGKVCNVCIGESPARDGHDVNPPCEAHAWEVLTQRVAEDRAIPGEAEDRAMWRLTRRLFDDVARSAEADAQRTDPTARRARFSDLSDAEQRRVVSGLPGVYASLAQVAIHRAPK
jgi:hypothetical protein